MQKQQLILISAGLVLTLGLFFFGKTVNPNKPAAPVASANTPTRLTTEQVIAKYQQGLSSEQIQKLAQLNNSVVRGDVHEQEIHLNHQLASYWSDSLHNEEMGAYYTGEAAKLENSEKNITFAAHLLENHMLSSADVSIQQWLATQAKELFDKALTINPDNDSTKVGIGVCYMFGNISDNPMQGILAVKEIADRHPDNLYAQMMLGLGGVQSGQYDKAIERFLIIVNKQPGNIEAILNLAGAYERKGDKTNAVKWYKQSLNFIQLPQAKKDIEERIKLLQ